MFLTRPERIFQKERISSEFARRMGFDEPPFPCSFGGSFREIRDKARDTDLTLQRTEADFFQLSRGA